MNKVIKILITVVALYLCSMQLNIFSVKEMLNNINYLFLIPILVSIICHLYFLASRWHFLNKTLHIKQSKNKIYYATFYGFALNQILPTSIGGDGYRIYILKQLKNKITNSIYAVTLDRFFGLYFLVLITMLSSLYLGKINYLFFFMSLAIFFTFIISFIIFLIDVQVRNKVINFFFKLNYDLNNLIFSKNNFNIVLSSIISKFFNILIFLFTLYLLNFDVTLDKILIIPLILFFGSLPISFAGWGLREGVSIYLFSFLFIDINQSFTVSFMFGFLQLMFALFVFIFNLLYEEK